MKKLTLVLFLVAAFCLIVAVSPVSADASANPANAGINSTSPFWFKDITPSSAKTLDAAFTAPAYKPLAGTTLDAAIAAATYKPLSGGTISTVFTAPTYKPSIGGTVAAAFTVKPMSTLKTSSGGYYYAPA